MAESQSMWDVAKEGLVEGLHRGLPTIGAIGGMAAGAKLFGHTGVKRYLGAGLGWLLGWTVQKAIRTIWSEELPPSGYQLTGVTGPWTNRAVSFKRYH